VLTHIDALNRPTMVDISQKTATLREASARTIVRLPQIVADQLQTSGPQPEINSPKGPVFATAIIAGTMAVKNTAQLIPFCHTLAITGCRIYVSMASLTECEIVCTVTTRGPTGVEMEALVGSTVAALTVYDMCKALSHDIVLQRTELISKSGGKNNFKRYQS
jgi:cyclic pyranopterin monophosphate synthase